MKHVQLERKGWCDEEAAERSPPCCSSGCGPCASCHRSHLQAGRGSPAWTTHLQTHATVQTAVLKTVHEIFKSSHSHLAEQAL